MKQEVMIVAGEASGDLHGAKLVRAMQASKPALCFSGLGGRELRKAGVEILFEASKIAVVGFFEVVSHLSDIINAQKILRRRLEQHKPVLLILIDFPDFNLILARKAKKLGIPIFYYISPQVWAWRSGRVKTIGRLVDKIGVILPFEEQFYRQRGVDAVYIGHPLLDSVQSTCTRDMFCRRYGIAPECKLVGILPGSRIKEIRSLLPVFLDAAQILEGRVGDPLVFAVPCASTISKEELLENGIQACSEKLEIRIIEDDRYDLMAACDAVIAASGTVTLELLLLNTPMVVAYRLSPVTYQLGRLLVDIRFFSLANLIAGEEIVPELLQEEAEPQRISDEIFKLIYDEKARGQMLVEFSRVRRLLGDKGASEKAANLALSLLKRDKMPNHV